MILHITDSENIVDKDFGYWLIPHIQSKLLRASNSYNWKVWDEYLTKTQVFPKLYTKNYFASLVIEDASKNLICEGIEGNIFIKINDKTFARGFDRVKLSNIAKVLNYGTISLKGSNIITDVFSYFSDNIESYINTYYQL